MSIIFFLRPVKDFDVGGWVPKQDYQQYIDTWKPEKEIPVEEELKVLEGYEKEIEAKVEALSEKKEPIDERAVTREKIKFLEDELYGLRVYKQILHAFPQA